VSRVNQRRLYWAVALIVVVYIVVTVIPTSPARGRADVTLVPFTDPIARFRDDITRYELLRDVARNVAAGGILAIGFLAATRRRAYAVAMTATTVFVAEILQAATPFARAADINDLIWSTLGAVLLAGGMTALSSLRATRVERGTW